MRPRLGKAVRFSQQNELSCEIQKKKRKLLGLGTNPLDNMSKAETDIVKHDKKSREKLMIILMNFLVLSK